MKKFFRIFAIMMIFTMCAFLSACGDKYKNLKFEVSYSFSADATDDEWIKIENNNLSIFYGGENDKLQIVENGNNITATVYLKVNVTGVNAKYLDNIKITNLGAGDHSGADLISTDLVGNNIVTPLNISFDKRDLDDNYIRTSLKFYETASSKSSELDFSVSPSLKEITMNKDNLLAVGVGGSVQLNEQFINYLPAGTLQVGAKFELDSVGSYTTGMNGNLVWQDSNAINSYRQMVTVSESGLVTVRPSYVFNIGGRNNYVIRVKATSTQNTNVQPALIDVYVVDRLEEYTPQLSFESTGATVGSDFALYCGSNYGYVDVKLNTNTFESIYKNGLETVNGKAIYELKIFVDGQPYNPNGSSVGGVDSGTFNGLKIEDRGDNVYRITGANLTPNQNRVEFKYVLSNLNIGTTGSAVASYSKQVNVNKQKLPTKIIVTNGYNESVTASNGEVVNQTIFSTANNLTLKLDTDVPNSRDTITITDATGTNGTFDISGWRELYNRTGEITSGDSISVKFAATGVSSGDLTLRVRAIPTTFAGVPLYANENNPDDYITITIRVTKVVTADRVLAYANYASEDINTPLSAEELDGAINIEENSTGYIYLKVYYAGGSGSFDASTIKLRSNNENVIFDNGTTLKTLDDYVITSGTEAGKNFNIYRVAVSVKENGQNAEIEVVSNDGKLTLLDSDTKIAVKSVHLVVGEIKINAKSDLDAIELNVDNSHQNFAVVVNKSVRFAIEDGENSGNAIKQIIPATFGDEEFYKKDGLNISALGTVSTDRNAFSFETITTNTKLLQFTTYYYTRDNATGVIVLASKVIIAEFAVYTPINGINKPEKDAQIAYIKGYQDVSSAVVEFNSTNTPSPYVMFTDGSAELNMVRYESAEPSSLIAVVTAMDGSTAINDPNIEILTSYSNPYTGRVTVTLKGETNLNGVYISIVNTRFNLINTEDSTFARVIITNNKPADYVRIWNDENNPVIDDSYAVDEQQGLNTIHLSLLNVKPEDSISASFYASAEWNELNSAGVRINDLDAKVQYYKKDSVTGFWSFVDYTAQGFTVGFEDIQNSNAKLVTLNALKVGGGGIFKVTIGAKNSIVDGEFTAYETVLVYIADGSEDNKYTISSEADLYAINNDLSANYVLSQDIDINITNNNKPIGVIENVVNEFNGSLSGEQRIVDYNGNAITIKHKINLLINVRNSAELNGEKYVGLFAILGERAVVDNLNLKVTFTGTVVGNANIGAVAGLNKGQIKNVNVQIANYDNSNTNNITINANSDNETANFGCLVGVNNGGIALTNDAVVCVNNIIVNSALTNNNIGLVVGTNNGTVNGNYQGKQSLESVNYNVISNLNINSRATTASFNVGAVAGTSNGSVRNVIVGGRITINTANGANSYVGGVAGRIINTSSSNSGVVDTCATFGLDINARNIDKVAGIAGFADAAYITNTKTILANVLFNNMETTGRMYAGTVAGVVAEARYANIRYSTVESFVTMQDEAFYGLGRGSVATSVANNVAGIAFDNDGSVISNCLVNANLAGRDTVFLLSNSTISNSYFIGKVSGINSTRNNFTTIKNNYKLVDINKVPSNGYAIILLDDGYYSAYEDVTYGVELLEKELVNYNELFELETDTTKSDLYYIDSDGKYVKATTIEEGVDYYSLIPTWRARANYTLVGDRLISTVGDFDSSVIYYHINNSDIANLYVNNNNEYVTYNSDSFDINTNYYLGNLKSAGTNTKNLITDLSTNVTNLLLGVITDGAIRPSMQDVWGLDKSSNAVNVNGAIVYLPYLVERVDGNLQPLMIVRPTDINVDINQKYVEDINSIYIDKGLDLDFLNSTIHQTAIVNFINNGEISSNTHQIVNTSDDIENPNGLVDLKVVQTSEVNGVVSGVQFSIESGVSYAYINGSNIVFTDVSGKTPIVVRCYSSFDPSIVEYIVFFTQPGVSKLIVGGENVSTSRRQGVDYETYVYVSSDENRNKTNILFTTLNLFNGQTVSSILSDIKNTNIRNYLTVKAEFGGETEYISVKDFQNNSLEKTLTVNLNAFDNERNYQDIKFTLMFDAYSYYVNNNGNSYFDEGTIIELASSVVRVNIYNSADKVVISSSGIQSAITSATLHFTATLYSGYVNADSDIQNNVAYIVNNQNQIVLTQPDQDSIILTLTPNQIDEVERLMRRAGVDNFVDLFDASFVCEYFEDEDGVGYKYDIYLGLKNSFEYRFIEEDITFNVNVSAQSNSNAQAEASFTFIPEPLRESGVSIENYAVTSIEPNNNYQTIITSSVPSGTIEPGGRGSVMVIKVQPSYSSVISAQITTEVKTFAQGNLQLEFEQIYFDVETQMYKTLARQRTEDGLGIKLDKISQRANGKDIYNGVIYVHAYIVDRLTGLQTSISAYLSVVTPDGVMRKECNLFTKFLPGASVSLRNGIQITNIEDGTTVKQPNSYLIQKNSTNIFDITLQGYQFNGIPTFDFEWLKEEGQELPYEKDNVLNYVRYGDMTDYTTLTPVDGRYTLQFRVRVGTNLEGKEIPGPFVMTVSLKLSIDNKSESADQSIKLYPVDYILRDVGYENLNNNRLNIRLNETKSVDLNFTTDSETSYNNEINARFAEDISKIVYEDSNGAEKNKSIADLFTINFNDVDTPLLDTNVQTFLYSRVDGNKLVITGNRVITTTIRLTINWGYRFDAETNQYRLTFNLGANDTVYERRVPAFTINVYKTTTEADPTRINNASEFVNMAAGQHYILMEDITLTSFTPITAAIGSLDGNNKVITIESFVDNNQLSNYGLFASLSTYDDLEGTHTSILKNVVVSYSNNVILNLANNTANQFVFGGLVANNSGLIYNCDVVNESGANKNILTINMKESVSENVSLTFGGLVGINSGVISNSRVGRIKFEKVSVDTSSLTSTKVTEESFNPLSMTIGSKKTDNVNNETQYNRYTAIAGGFVGRNSGTISSSYFANASLINYSSESASSRTAGFVAENERGGSISYSYVRADEDTISTNVARAKGEVIENASNGTVAGFVHYNNGDILDSFANTIVKSRSTYVSGFAYENATNGYIKNCYAACGLNDGVGAGDEQPFIGLSTSTKDPLSNGKMENVYYYDANEGITQEEVTSETMPQAVALNTNNIRESKNLHGFVFISTNNPTERNQGVWTYNPVDSYENRTLPELTSANIIAVSNRYELNGRLTNAYGYAMGSQKNPHIIRDAKEFNQVFTDNNNSSSFTGYVRLIDDINFNGTDIATRASYTLGGSNITSIDGNGMTISNIELNTTGPSTTEIGLFANIKNSYIKNVNLSLASGEPSAFRAMYLGGLAGTIDSSVIVNVNVDGANTNLNGANFVGGLAGLIKGSTLISGVSANVNVSTSVTRNSSAKLYYTESEFNGLASGGYYSESYSSYLSNLSYAGGLAGVIDTSKRGDEDFNLSYIDINLGKNTSSTENTNGNITISADFAGGIAGYAGRNVKALRLKYHIGLSDSIQGGYVAGGLFGVSLAQITASQVTADIDVQYTYDTTFAKYIENVETKASEPAIDYSKIGNKNLIQSKYFAGGLVGVGLSRNAVIDSCYSKASMSGVKLGGLVGVSLASDVKFSYATPYINNTSNARFNNNVKVQIAGGLIGEAYGTGSSLNTSSNREVREWAFFVQHILGVTKTTDIQNTFSTLLLDINEDWNDVQLDYIIANQVQTGTGTNAHVGGQATGVYAGYVNNYDIYNVVVNQQLKEVVGAYNTDLVELYRKNADDFNEIFTAWANEYWSLSNDKYFPILENEEATNYIQIKTEEDLSKISGKGNYMIMNDIQLTRSYKNWVIGGETAFSGRLVGSSAITDNNNGRPRIWGITLTPDQNETAGFFRFTNGATISNLTFEWGTLGSTGSTASPGVLVSESSITTFGGVTASDSYSKISNVVVKTMTDDHNKDITAPMLTTENGQTIKGFGGIIGNATASQITSCSYSGNVTADMSDAGRPMSFGGLVASGKQDGLDDGEERNEYVIITSSKVGDTNGGTFNLNVKDGNSISIGGVVGDVKNGNVSSLQVGPLEFNITASRVGSVFVGGLVGMATDRMQVNDDNVYTNITVKENSEINSQLQVAGLIGDYSSSSNTILSASNVVVNTNINLKEIKVPSIATAGGIANVDTANVQIATSSFNGTINTEGASIDGEIDAGGVIGHVTNGGIVNQIILDTVFNNLDINAGSAIITSLYMGGLVAGGTLHNNSVLYELYVSNSLNAGRLLVNALSGDLARLNVYIGGVAGVVGDAYIANLISIPTIVTDGIKGEAIKSLDEHTHALFGQASQVKTTVENLTGVEDIYGGIYYSTDYSIYSDPIDVIENKQENIEGDRIYNLAANALVNSINATSWKNTLSNQIWNLSNSNLPYPVNLRTQLLDLGILDRNTNRFVEGSCFRPVIVNASMSTLNLDEYSGYNYFIIQQTFSSTITGELNGVIIGNQENFTIDGIGQNNDILSTITNGTETYTGFIPKVNKHSVVSNLHIQFGDNAVISTNGITGLVVGLNEGVVSNVSVQGNGLKISGDNVSLIVARNDGIVQYCYSSAEILEANVTNSITGIVYQNAGIINSCYFTGYINNKSGESTCVATGILNNSLLEADTNFVYNNYMAGVIEAGLSAFIADITGLNAENNFIDNYTYGSNPTNEVVGLNRNSTLDLFSALGFKGSWYTVKPLNGNVINTNALTFGYNFGYPVYKFNRVNTATLNVNDIQFQLNTGTGAVTDSVDTLEARANKILQKGVDYEYAYKIPHLGVLSSINGLLQYDLNYLIIHDIKGVASTVNGNKNYIQWASIGDDTTEFNGVLVSNKNYLFTELTSEEQTEENENDSICVISDLANRGLFANIGKAYFGCINFGGKFNEFEGGVLGNISRKSSNDGQVIVRKISFVKLNGTEIPMIVAPKQNLLQIGNLGGLFGTIGINNTIDIYEFETPSPNVKHNDTLEIVDSNCNAGLIAAENNGTIYLHNIHVSVKYSSSAKTPSGSLIGSVGGLVGVNKGLIEEKEPNTQINEDENKANRGTVTVYSEHDSNENNLVKLGGLVGTLDNGTLRALSVSIDSTLSINATRFGGIAAEITNSGNRIQDCTFMKDTSKLLVGYNRYFGIVTAEMAIGANVEVVGLEFGKSTSVDEKTYNLVITTSRGGLYDHGEDAVGFILDDADVIEEGGVGTFVGTLSENAEMRLSLEEAHGVYLETFAVSNLGGIAGDNKGGKIYITKQDETLSVSLKGAKNVGGVYGRNLAAINGDDYIKVSSETGEDISDNYFDYLNESFATVYVVPGNENVGGLFGYATSNLSNLTNSNRITLSNVGYRSSLDSNRSYDTYSKDNTMMAINVGGVVGTIKLFDGGEYINLNNIANIKYLDGQNPVFEQGEEYHINIVTSADYREDENKNFATVIVSNVGGVIGNLSYVSNADAITISGLENQGQIQGYQNVGGLVGFVSGKINITPTERQKTDSATDDEVQYNEDLINKADVNGVINVGGLIGYLGNGASIDNAIISANVVIGNVNVGSIVGMLHSKDGEGVVVSSITNCTAEKDGVQILVIGALYNSAVWAGNESTYHYERTYFLPTNIGGVVGMSTFNSIITKVNVNNILVTSCVEGARNGTDNTNMKGAVISTVSNYIAQPVDNDHNVVGEFTNAQYYEENSKANSDKSSYVYLAKETCEKVNFNNIKSGFGGFIGGVLGDIDNTTTKDNTLTNITVNAQLGVNVGALYGYYNGTPIVRGKNTSGTPGATEGTNDNFSNIVELAGNAVSVDGAYNIGSIFGYLESQNPVTFDVKKSNIFGSVHVNLQNEISGMYVGGVIGKMTASPGGDNISLNNSGKNIIVDTSTSYYIGGLVGRYVVGSGLSGEATFNGTLGEYTGDNSVYTKDSGIVNNNGITDTSAVANMGGLIGMLKVEKSEGSRTVNVSGEHQYAFTINTIENSNYADGTSQYGSTASSDGSSVFLVAQAYYINLDTFNIAATSNTEWYANRLGSDNKPGDTDINDSTYYKGIRRNPINGSVGWVKEYTMFRAMQRNIPAGTGLGQSGTEEWDSIAVLYDADCVTGVGTIENLGLTGVKDLQRGENDKEIMNDDGSFKNDYICYTIYEEEDGFPKLYSRVGIAAPFKNDEGGLGEPHDNIVNTTGNKIGYVFGFTELGVDYYYINLNDTDNKTQGLTYYQWRYERADGKNVNGEYDTVNNNSTSMTSSGKGEEGSILVEIVYKVSTDTYHYNVTDTSDGTEGAYFIFEVIYNNASFPTGYSGGNPDGLLPKDGSIFNVQGIMTNATEQGALFTQNENTWLKDLSIAVAVIGVLIDIALTIGTGGVVAGPKALYNAAKGTAKAAKGIKKLAQVAKSFAKLAKKSWKAIKIGIEVISAGLLIGYFQSKQASVLIIQNEYFKRRDFSFGYLSGSYNREIKYNYQGDRLVLDSSVEDFNFYADQMYIYYSSTRPADYYLEHYIGLVNEDSYTEENKDKLMPIYLDITYKDILNKVNDNSTTDVYYQYSRDGILYDVYPKYTYKYGCYYISGESGKVTANKEQLFDSSIVGNDELSYISAGGRYYVRGKYENGKYTLPKDYAYGNNLQAELVSNNYVFTGADNKVITEDVDFLTAENNSPYSYIAVTQNWLKENKKQITDFGLESKTYKDPLTGDITPGKNYYNGYSVMKNVYYTADGLGRNALEIDNKGNDTILETKKSAVFTYSADKPNGKEGVDYITINYTYEHQDSNGNDISTEIQCYMKLDTIDSVYTEAKDYTAIKLSGVLGSTPTPSPMRVNLYPKSFENVYYNGDAPANATDDTYYYVESSITGANTAATGVEHNPTYFYYDGGYIYENGNIYTRMADSVITTSKNNNNETVEHTIYGTNSIDMFDENGNPIYKDATNKISYTLEDLVNHYYEWENKYYIVNILEKDEGELVYDGLEESMKIGANYKLKEEGENKTKVLYQVNALYSYEKGSLVKYTLTYSYKGEDNPDSNKFLINANKEIYTRYKYNGVYFGSGTWKGDKENYHIWQEGLIMPNPGKTTYLSESVCVTLGSGGDVYYQGITQSSVTAGSIKLI